MKLSAHQFYVAVLLVTCSLSSPARALDVKLEQNPQPAFPKTRLYTDTKPDTKEPVVFTADDMEYDQQANMVHASGHVEISQGGSVVLADYVTYDQAKGTVSAWGNVVIMEASGNVYFADDMDLQSDMKMAVVRQFKVRFSDNSLFVAAEARRISEDVTEVKKGLYSPCNICPGSDDDPLWQLRASYARIDQEEQKVSYDDASLEIYGMPVFYTPYFAHPMPGADNKSGLLEPVFQQSTNLGATFKQPVYYSMAPDRDLTVTPIYTSLEGGVLAGQYRQRFNSGYMDVDGSITKPQSRDAGGVVSKGQDIRGHVNATGLFTDNRDYDWGFSIRRTTDDTYLRRYGFSNDTLLTSKIYGERYNFSGPGQRSYAGIRALKFDGLTSVDDDKRSPFILPLADFDWQSAPSAYGSRFLLSGNAMALTRSSGADSRRLSTTAGWKLPYITSNGQVLEFATQLRADIYSVSDVALAGGGDFSGETGRLVPEASLAWRYPFIRRGDTTSIVLEPVIMASISPNGGNSEEIPNEDSQVPEFNTSNLFSTNRFAGYDRLEGGAQLAYGLRGQAQIESNKYVDWLVGQHYQQENNANFPYSSDVNDQASDYVAKLGMNYDHFSLAYRTRLDKDSLTAKRTEIDSGFSYYPVGLSVSYLSLKNDPTLTNKEELSGAGTFNFSKEWKWIVSARRDLELHETTSIATGLQFHNECVDILNILAKEYTQDRDIKPATTFLFRISFKNLE